MHRSKRCAVSRRDVLHTGLGGLLGGSLGGLLAARAHSARAGEPIAGGATARSCILIWMDGGPTHYETFDPKPQAPVEVRGQFHPIATAVAGVQFSQHLRRLSALADKFSVIRSIRHNQGNHGAGNHYMMTGAPPRIPVGCGAFVSFHPSLGSMVSHQLPARAALPSYFSLPRMTRSGGPHFLGAKHAPFVVADDPNRSSFRVRDVALPSGLESGRFQSRQSIRQSLDRMKRLDGEAAGDPVRAIDDFYRQGFQLVTSPEAQKAFDIGRESPAVRDKYGRNPFGQRALLARRLVEAGVPFVTLNEGGWDHHRDIFSALNKRLPSFEATVAALIEDLDQRGRLDDTLVVALGEFGRTPKVNSRGGRDHWSNAMSVLMAGGGTPGGVVVGATDRQGYSAVERVLSPEDFVSTIYRKLGIDPERILHTPDGRPVRIVRDGNPIPELMG